MVIPERVKESPDLDEQMHNKAKEALRAPSDKVSLRKSEADRHLAMA